MSAIPQIALKPPRQPVTIPRRQQVELCTACDTPISNTGECAGCTGS